MVVAVLCPEGLLASAIYQRIDASILEGYAPLYLQAETRADTGWLTQVLKRFLGKAGRNEVSSLYFPYTSTSRSSQTDLELNLNLKPPRKRQYPFGLIHAIYATMGGFAFNIPAGSEAGEPHTVPNSKAFLYIMENFPDIIPDISEESITDRAESSPLSKALPIVQVGWFCANSLLRLMQHFPLSPLEVSTAAHSFCTLITYFVWWSKPQNIAKVTPMKGQRAREVHALLMCSGREYSEALSMAQRTVAGDSLMVTNCNYQGRIVLAANALRHRLPRLEVPPPEDPFMLHCGLHLLAALGAP